MSVRVDQPSKQNDNLTLESAIDRLIQSAKQRQLLDQQHEQHAHDILGTTLAGARAFSHWKMLTKHHKGASNAIASTPPFSSLDAATQKLLAAEMIMETFSDGQVIIEAGAHDSDVYILAEGTVEFVNPAKRQYLGFIAAPAYFGEWEVLFETPRETRVVAAGAGVITYKMSAQRFLGLLSSGPLRYALIRNLRDKQFLFRPIQTFVNAVADGVTSGEIDISQMIAKYRDLHPAIHSKMDSHSEIDVGGWLYAVRRLPTNLTTTYVYLLTQEVPTIYLYRDVLSSHTRVTTPLRRRTVFDLNHGKSLVLIQESTSDVVDFVSMLCLHCIESKKLRRKLSTPQAIKVVHEHLSDAATRGEEGDRDALLANEDATLRKLTMLSEAERVGLQTIWPGEVIAKIWDILVHHEDYSVYVDLRRSYMIGIREKWSEQVRKAALELFDGRLDNVEVDIVSSNTHSVVNCLSPYLHMRKEQIMGWTAEHIPDVLNVPLHNETDRLYAVAWQYMHAHPDQFKLRRAEELQHGIITLSETEFTGISVNLIDVGKLNPALMDPVFDCVAFSEWRDRLQHSPGKKRRLIVNVDYAFGQQAEDIMECLVLIFGNAIRSVNVLGKAGAMQGARGDILLATHLINQEDDSVMEIPNNGLTKERLNQLSGREVWSGGVLTVIGTLLQDRTLLFFYKKLWNCVGLEMEGSFYMRKAEHYTKLGMLSPTIHKRFLYYTSDIPLFPEASLAKDLTIVEGIPPLYAVTRAILEQCIK